jgi:hypothetical protein
MIVGFAVTIVAMLAVDVAGRSRGRGDAALGRPGRAVAPLGTALTAALRTGTGRVLVLGVWLWMGWHFLAR